SAFNRYRNSRRPGASWGCSRQLRWKNSVGQHISAVRSKGEPVDMAIDPLAGTTALPVGTTACARRPHLTVELMNPPPRVVASPGRTLTPFEEDCGRELFGNRGGGSPRDGSCRGSDRWNGSALLG